MRIAFVTAFPRDPAAPHGGVEAVSAVLVPALARLDDLEVHVVTSDPKATRPETAALGGAIVHRLPRSRHRTLVDALGPGRREVARAVLDLAPDVIHAHDVYGLMVKGLPIPRVLTIHGFIHADTRVSGTPLARFRAAAWRWVETSAWADPPHLISISPYVRERLAGIARGAIHDIDNPIAEDFFAIPRDERPGTIFSAALVCPRKNTLGLVEAFARLAARDGAAVLRLAGAAADEGYADRVRERVGALGLSGRVAILGPLDRAEVRRELARASVFALTSLEEGAPLGIEEAMAAGVPVLASNRCGMPYLVREGETGLLVDPEDPADVADGLARLLGDGGLRAAMSVRARQVARERFHPDAVARRTREVYLRAAGAGVGAGVPR